MKLWYDDKKIPMWVEWLAVIVVGVIVGASIALMVLGYNLASLIN